MQLKHSVPCTCVGHIYRGLWGLVALQLSWFSWIWLSATTILFSFLYLLFITFKYLEWSKMLCTTLMQFLLLLLLHNVWLFRAQTLTWNSIYYIIFFVIRYPQSLMMKHSLKALMNHLWRLALFWRILLKIPSTNCVLMHSVEVMNLWNGSGWKHEVSSKNQLYT